MAFNEEIETWKDVYGIEERYKAKCCSENDGKYWLMQVMDEWQVNDRSPVEYLNILNRQTKRSPFAESNFLRKAFLEGCDRPGMFSIKKDALETKNQKPKCTAKKFLT